MPTQDKPGAGEPTGGQAHTPGPWTIDEPIATKNRHYVTAKGKLIGKLDGFSEANARLIAAAPETKAQRDELLAVCKALVEAAYLRGIPGVVTATDRAAIARVEGRAR